jgi:alpha-galactosidase
MSIHDKKTGEDLYPLFRERWEAFDDTFEPLSRRVFNAFGLMPVPGDEHLCEYLPWVSDPITKPWEKYDITLYEWDLWDRLRQEGYFDIAKMVQGEMGIDDLKDEDSEGAKELIEAMAGGGNHYHLAVNLPNQGYITNLPEGAIVEVPGHVAGSGVHGIGVGSLPQGIVELFRREITTAQLGVDAAVLGDRNLALQALLLDPVIRDMDVAEQVLDDYLTSYKEYLPQFFK